MSMDGRLHDLQRQGQIVRRVLIYGYRRHEYSYKTSLCRLYIYADLMVFRCEWKRISEVMYNLDA